MFWLCLLFHENDTKTDSFLIYLDQPDKYYNECLFHKVEKDFIAQTGDTTGTGTGGDYIYK
jgi:cyclophilin family peptidyl-prolyl cis-trans isomerase